VRQRVLGELMKHSSGGVAKEVRDRGAIPSLVSSNPSMGSRRIRNKASGTTLYLGRSWRLWSSDDNTSISVMASLLRPQLRRRPVSSAHAITGGHSTCVKSSGLRLAS
jgi:hypothetical protein